MKGKCEKYEKEINQLRLENAMLKGVNNDDRNDNVEQKYDSNDDNDDNNMISQPMIQPFRGSLTQTQPED